MQVRCRVLDVMVLVLTGAAFRGEQATAVDLLEIAIGKFVVSLGVLRFLVVDSQMPLAVFGKTVEANEFIFLCRGWPVLAPGIALVEDKSSFADKVLGMLICSSVKRHGHGCSPFSSDAFIAGASVLPERYPRNRRSKAHAAMMAINLRVFLSIVEFDNRRANR
jgi:hypothetical protein